MANALVNGERAEIRCLCSFYVRKYKSYIGRNPETGKQIKIKSEKLPFLSV